MPDSRPLAGDLLTVVAAYLERDVAPQVTPDHRFQLRIVARLLQTVRREIELGDAADAAETDRLRALLGGDGGRDELDRALAERIRAGGFATDDPALLAHLRATLVDALRINNPRWVD